MGNKFNLEYSPRFFKEIDSIDNYIRYNLDNRFAADNLTDAIEIAIQKRLEHPLDFEKYYTKAGNVYYRIYVNNYIIFYTVNDEIMKVRRIIYKKSNYKNKLYE